jgi:uncharacterized protein involved in exopolysaccharide biosynthesis
VSSWAESSDGDDAIDVRELVATLWTRRWHILVATVVSTVLFGVAAFVLTPIYRAAVVLTPVNQEADGMGLLNSALGQLGGLAALAGIQLGGGNAQTEESLAVLRSRQFTEEFIREQDLMPELFHRKWDEGRRAWRDPDDPPTLAEAWKFFDRKVRRISQDKKTGLITLQVEWRDPAKAAAWANLLVERLNGEMRARAIAKTNASVGYLQKELEGTAAVDTRAAINRLMEAQINQRMFANVTKEYSLRVVDRALPPDRKDKVRPKRAMMLIGGMLVGLLIGATFAYVAAKWSRPARQPG